MYFLEDSAFNSVIYLNSLIVWEYAQLKNCVSNPQVDVTTECFKDLPAAPQKESIKSTYHHQDSITILFLLRSSESKESLLIDIYDSNTIRVLKLQNSTVTEEYLKNLQVARMLLKILKANGKSNGKLLLCKFHWSKYEEGELLTFK